VRNLLLILTFIFTISQSTLFSQDNQKETPPAGEIVKFSFTVYPLPLLEKWFSAECEYTLSNNVTVAFEGKYWKNSDTDTAYEEWNWKLLQVGPGIRYYPKRAHEGFFVGAYFSYLKIEVTYEDTLLKEYGSGKVTGYAATCWIGYKWIHERTLIELSTGLTYTYLNDAEITVRDSYGNTHKDKADMGYGSTGWAGIGFGIGIHF
jgi:hypothetical protein